jgi:hypothetical protein
MAIKTVHRLADEDGNVYLRATMVEADDADYYADDNIKLIYTPEGGGKTTIEMSFRDASYLAKALEELVSR